MEEKKRIYNINMTHLEKVLDAYKKETGVSNTAVFAAIGKSPAHKQTIAKNGIAVKDFEKLCYIVDANPKNPQFFIGGTPLHDKKRAKLAPEEEMERMKESVEELRRMVLCVSNENKILKDKVDYLEKELGVTKPKEVSVVKKTV